MASLVVEEASVSVQGRARFGVVEDEGGVVGDVPLEEIVGDQFVDVEGAVFVPVTLFLNFSVVDLSDLELDNLLGKSLDSRFLLVVELL